MNDRADTVKLRYLDASLRVHEIEVPNTGLAAALDRLRASVPGFTLLAVDDRLARPVHNRWWRNAELPLALVVATVMLLTGKGCTP